MGGVAAVRAITTVQIAGAGYATGDTAEGAPPALSVFAFIETRDDRRPRLVQDVAMLQRPDSSLRTVTTLTLTGDSVIVERAGTRRMRGPRAMDAWLTEAPENVLLAALEAKDLVSDGDSAVRFSWRGRTVQVRFGPKSPLPAAVTLNDANGPLTTVYSRWKRVAHGITYPSQWDVRQNDTPAESFTADRVMIAIGAT